MVWDFLLSLMSDQSASHHLKPPFSDIRSEKGVCEALSLQIERLVLEFPRFDDSSIYLDKEVNFYKLAQLAFWGIHGELAHSDYFRIEDMESMTAFADYIVPVALIVMKITQYSEELEEKIMNGKMIERNSTEEIEIRAATIYATAKLTESVNRRRKDVESLIIPQLDYRLWKHYHATHFPHHLTYTTMY